MYLFTVYDCPGFPGVHQYASLATGASIKAAECLMSGSADIAIHWTGGWHHAKRLIAQSVSLTQTVQLVLKFSSFNQNSAFFWPLKYIVSFCLCPFGDLKNISGSFCCT